MYSWLLSLPQSVLYDVFLLKTLRGYAAETPKVPTARISVDCDRTWSGSETRECAGFGIFTMLWQTRGLENKVQLWPILSCVIRRFLCPNMVIKSHAYLYRWSGNFLVIFCVLFHLLLQSENVLPQFGVSFECSIVTKISEGTASRETNRYLTRR